MTQEEKQLLLKDLCARLPYGVVLDVDTTDWRAPQGHIKVKIEGIGILSKDMSLIVNGCYYGDKYKPYLRPMSSMTEEEAMEYVNCGNIIANSPQNNYLIPNPNCVDWLNRNHFDYRNLIPRDLVLEAPERMYNITK